MEQNNEVKKEENYDDVVVDMAEILANSQKIKMWNNYYLNESRRWERD